MKCDDCGSTEFRCHDCDTRDPYIPREGREPLFVEEWALAELLREDVVFCNAFPYRHHDGKEDAGTTVVLFANCNDVFAWACADAEDIGYNEVQTLYDAWKADAKWGVIRWVCKKRNQQPQPPIVRDMKADGAWGADMEALPSNTRDREVHQQIAAVAAKSK